MACAKLICAFIFSQLVILSTPSHPDKITVLPGQPVIDFDQYSGYVPVLSGSLFYYFVETPKSAGEKPVVLWLHGGPGCSGVGAGGFQEIGPFRVSGDVANLLFVDSPAGVGFSYRDESVSNQTGDIIVAEECLVFLYGWLERFPDYKDREIYIAGEGYAGNYAPELAALILQNTTINLQGILVGNPNLEDGPNFLNPFYEYLWSHGILADSTYFRLKRACNFTDVDLLGPECKFFLGKAENDIGLVDLGNFYNPICREMGLRNHSYLDRVEVYDPCSSVYIKDFFNTKNVQDAFHSKPINWGLCSAQFEWKDSPTSVVPLIQALISRNISVWLYSGDTNAVIPFTSTKMSISSMNLSTKTHWHPWYSDHQVGGYVVGYEGLVFATVRGAGQQVSRHQPQRAMTLISSFLKGTLPPFRP